MALSEFGSEISELNETSEQEEVVDSDFESELDQKYEEYLSGKSKEELIQMRSEARAAQREELIKMRDELMKMKEEDGSDDDSEHQLILKKTLHR